MKFKKTIFFIAFSVCISSAKGQDPSQLIDSLKKNLSTLQNVGQKVATLDLLSRTLMNTNLKEADEYGQQLILVGEESRDRKLMFDAYMSNGLRCGYFHGNKKYLQQSISFYNKALEIARQNKMDEETGKVFIRLATVHLTIPDKDKSLNYANQAFSIISTFRNDSLKAETHIVYGDIYLSRNNKILSLRHYLNALNIAEEIKFKGQKDSAQSKKASLMRDCYMNLSGFYANIEDYDKAIDYVMEANKKLDNIIEGNTKYAKVIDLNSIGNLFAQKKSYDIAITYFERSLALADSLGFMTLKIPGYISLLNQYLRMYQPQNALDYINSSSGQNLKKFLTDFGFSGAIDQAYAVIYTELGRYDSAKYYFDKAATYFENTPNEVIKMNYLSQMAKLHKQIGEYNKSIDLFLKVKEIGDRTAQLEAVKESAQQLDSLYTLTGKFQLASEYCAIYYQYKDSIQKLNKANELAQIEAADEQRRLERIEQERLEAKRKRYNIQYLGITIGITALFILLVMFGMFKVSTATIKMIGFFAFIMFFEFIFLIFKKNIQSITHGEPLKDLMFMIGLAVLLLPLHHWLEKKVIHYLTSHNRLTAAGHHIRKVFGKQKSPIQ